MFKAVFLKQIRRGLLTFRFIAALLVLFSLINISVVLNTDDYQRRAEAHKKLAYTAKQEIADKYIPSTIQPTMHWAPSRLSIFAQGEDKRLGNSVTIQRWQVPVAATGNLSDNELLASLPAFDLVSIFNIALMLLGLLLSYDAVSGEREQGTLKLMLVGAVRRSTVYLATWSALVTLLVVSLLISLLSALLVISFGFGIQFTVTELAALGLITLAGIATAGLSVALGMLTSSLFQRSSSALLAALLLWMGLSLVLPVAAVDTVRANVPLRSPNEMSLLRDQTAEEVDRKKSTYRQNNTPNALGFMGDGYNGQHIYVFDAPSAVWPDAAQYFRYYEGLHQERAERIAALWREHELRRQEQEQVASTLSLLTPFHYIRTSLTNLSATDYEQYELQLESARRYRNAMLQSFRERGYFGDNAPAFISRRTEAERQSGFQQRFQEFQQAFQSGESVTALLGPERWDPLPADIVPPMPDIGRQPDFSESVFPLGMLLVFMVLLTGFGLVQFLRYDVR